MDGLGVSKHFWRYAMACGWVGVAFAIRCALAPWLGEHLVFLFFLPVALLAGWQGRFGPGLVALLLGLVLGFFWFLPPLEVRQDGPPEIMALLVCLSTGLLGLVLIENLHRQKERITASQAHELALQREIQQRQCAEETLRKSEQALLQANQRLRIYERLVESSPSLIAVMDQNSVFRMANASYLTVRKKTVDEVVGHRAWELLSEEEFKTVRGYIEQCLAGQEVRYQRWFTYPGLGRRFMEVSYYPLLEENNRVNAVVMEIHDATERKQAEEALQKSEERQRVIFDTLPSLIFSKDLQGRYLFANRQVSVLLQKDMDQILGKTDQELFPPAIAEQFRVQDRQVSESGHPLTTEELVPFPDGLRSHLVNKFLLRDASGQAYALCGISTDINDEVVSRKALARQNKRLQFLFETAGQLLSVKDPESMVDELVEKISAHLGLDVCLHFKADEASHSLKLASSAGIPPDLAEELGRLELGRTACGQESLPGQVETTTNIQKSTDPKLRLFQKLGIRACTCQPLTVGGHVLGSISFATRQQDQFEAEDLQLLETICHYIAIAKERDLYTRELEERVAERTAHLQETIKSLETLCYNLAHDLRAPNRTMEGFARLLLAEYGPTLDPTIQGYLQRIAQAATRNDRLILDMLSYGLAGHVSLPYNSYQLEVLLWKVIESLAHDIQKRKAEVKLQGPFPILWTNSTALEQVLSNLLSNAVKFVAPGIAPQITVWAEEKPHAVRICVRDNGIGIPVEHHAKIFKVFERLHPEEAYPGTGIGLAIVQKYIERMGGQVGLQSVPGQGSCFWLELPPRHMKSYHPHL